MEVEYQFRCRRPLGRRPLGCRPLGCRPLGRRPLGRRPLGRRPLGLHKCHLLGFGFPWIILKKWNLARQ